MAAQTKKKVFQRKAYKAQPLGTVDSDGFTLVTIEESNHLVYETWTK